MFSSWLLVLVILMVGVGGCGGCKKTHASKHSHATENDVSEYQASSDSKTKYREWDQTIKTARASLKGKAPAIPTAPGKKSPPRQKKKMGGIHIEEPLSVATGADENIFQIDTARMKAFEKHLYIGERHVNVGELRERSASFALLYDQGSLAQICQFP